MPDLHAPDLRYQYDVRSVMFYTLYLLHVADLQYGVTTQHCLTATNLGLIHARLITVYFSLRCFWLGGGGGNHEEDNDKT